MLLRNEVILHPLALVLFAEVVREDRPPQSSAMTATLTTYPARITFPWMRGRITVQEIKGALDMIRRALLTSRAKAAVQIEVQAKEQVIHFRVCSVRVDIGVGSTISEGKATRSLSSAADGSRLSDRPNAGSCVVTLEPLRKVLRAYDKGVVLELFTIGNDLGIAKDGIEVARLPVLTAAAARDRCPPGVQGADSGSAPSVWSERPSTPCDLALIQRLLGGVVEAVPGPTRLVSLVDSLEREGMTISRSGSSSCLELYTDEAQAAAPVDLPIELVANLLRVKAPGAFVHLTSSRVEVPGSGDFGRVLATAHVLLGPTYTNVVSYTIQIPKPKDLRRELTSVWTTAFMGSVSLTVEAVLLRNVLRAASSDLKLPTRLRIAELTEDTHNELEVHQDDVLLGLVPIKVKFTQSLQPAPSGHDPGRDPHPYAGASWFMNCNAHDLAALLTKVGLLGSPFVDLLVGRGDDPVLITDDLVNARSLTDLKNTRAFTAVFVGHRRS